MRSERILWLAAALSISQLQALAVASPAPEASPLDWLSQDFFADLAHQYACTISVRSTTASARNQVRVVRPSDVVPVSLRELFGDSVPPARIGGVIAQALYRESADRTHDLSVYLARSRRIGRKHAVVLLIERTPPGKASENGRAFGYAEANAFVGPVFSFAPTSDRIYFFQCLPKTELKMLEGGPSSEPAPAPPTSGAAR